MKVIIAGTRTWTDEQAIQDVLAYVEENVGPITEIVSGGATGADLIGEAIAIESELPIKRFLPDWERLGKSAGPVRNRQMAEYADLLVLAWDGESKGSLNMLRTAREYNLPVYGVIR